MQLIDKFSTGIVVVLVLAAFGGCSPESTSPDGADVALNNRGVALMGYFDYPGAYEAFNELVERRPGWQDARTNLAVALMNRQEPGDENLALQELEVVLSGSPDDARANYIAGLLHLYLGDVDTAAIHFGRTLSVDPDDAYAHYYLGQCLSGAGDNVGALERYRKAMTLDPYLRSAYYSAAQVLQSLGQADEAARQIELFERFANNPRARLAEFKYTRMGPKSLALAIGGQAETTEPAAARPDGRLFSAARSMPGDSVTVPRGNLSTADIDQNGSQEVVVAGKDGAVLISGMGTDFAGIDRIWADVADINAVAWGDIDNDGDIDAYLCRDGENLLWLQDEFDEWRRAEVAAGVGDSNRDCADVAMVDADHDGDLDILVANREGGDNLLNNNRDGTFRSLANEIGVAADPAATHRVITTDIDSDRDVDLLFLRHAPPHVLLINDRLWRYQAATGLDSFLNADLSAVAALDIDADGQVELAGIDSGGRLMVWRVGADGQWQGEPVYSSDLVGDEGADLAAMDFSGDGQIDLAILAPGAFEIVEISDTLQATRLARERYDGFAAIPVVQSATEGPSLLAMSSSDGKTLLEWAPGPGRFAFTTLSLSGKHDDAETMRSNASGIGTGVSLRNGSRWTVSDTFKNSSLPGHSHQPLALGLRGRDRADFVALHWSDGVFQTELDLQSGDVRHIAETERQLSSCPVLFAWNGTEFEFVTDLLGVGGLGGFVEPGVVGTPRPWERLLLPPNSVEAEGDRLLFKLTEPMQENAYLDSVLLERYDLPAGWHMALDERMATGAPQVTGEALFYRTAVEPVAATSSSGADVLPLIAAKDNRAMAPGAIDRRFIGLLEKTETLTLEFAAPIKQLSDVNGAVPVLLADAWVEYPYSQTVFSAWQAGLSYRSVTLEARVGGNAWQIVYPEFGYPAGMPREMSLPLGELPKGTNALRLSWNRELYWDRIRIVFAEPPPPAMRTKTLSPSVARVAKTGFAKRTTLEQRRPHYDYASRVPFWDTEYATGFYTRLGEITELIVDSDDALAIVGPGEELHMEFVDSRPLQPELRRWYVLESRGWAKDKDLYTYQGDTVGPLPRANPDADEARRDALHEKYNNRFQAGR